VGIVHEPIEYGVGNGRVAEPLRMPPFLIGWCLR
jgi:hypothetical protein